MLLLRSITIKKIYLQTFNHSSQSKISLLDTPLRSKIVLNRVYPNMVILGVGWCILGVDLNWLPIQSQISLLDPPKMSSTV